MHFQPISRLGSRIRLVGALSIVLAAACRGGSGNLDDGGQGGSVSSATELKCPFPGKLPFELESTGFKNSDAKLTGLRRSAQQRRGVRHAGQRRWGHC